VQKLAAVAGAYVKTKDFRDRFVVPYSIEPVGNAPEAFAAFMRDDRARYAKIVRSADAKPD
jgi:tripartite-type tricarboxylate transporter receptor subunit TctC